MLKIAVLISGSGSNLQAIIDAVAGGVVQAEIRGVLSNRADAYGLTRAQQQGLPTAVIAHGDYPDREAFDQAMIRQLDSWGIDLVVLAGFMRILTPGFVQHFEGRLLNIHPSLLPKYKGLHTHRRALEAGDSEHGCSVHFVSAELDGGPVIAQARVPVHPDDTEAGLTERVHKSEHLLYPRVIGWLADGSLEYGNGQPRFEGRPLAQPLQFVFDH
ncbi:MAG: formyltetrahydrofolate-dependent phosphoribosylglycinamide formyltransferase [Moraxellaceae bacterium]|jgi:phosphoribosylglycinamide formyltransferase-1|nr:formyltetrahydrofolate-dependent phosphoribosylglycinamide formyltransferase [Moraxellaceae bacterium]MDF3031265.1 formyltetrahydrofolate-dependent phosphoribosylglycinamide formyltransferase [Moraxellaceae bacterium]